MTLLGTFGGMRVGEVTQHTHLSRPAVSHHLKILKDAGIVKFIKRGTMNFYYTNDKNELWGRFTLLVAHLNELIAELGAQNEKGVALPCQDE